MEQAEGKNIKITEEAPKKIRVFSDREPFDVEVPDDVLEGTEGCPISVTIQPMTRTEAVTRERLKKRIDKERRKAVVGAGVKWSDFIKFQQEISKIAQKLIGLGDNEAEVQKLTDKFNKKWEALADKLAIKDETGIEDAEDAVIENAVHVFVKNCISLNYPKESHETSAKSFDEIHPDLFKWILSQIEDNSYLSSGEITGF